MDGCFIGGPPHGRFRKNRYASSTDFLLENAYYILTPGGQVAVPGLSAFMELIASLGAIPMALTCQEHDYITAAVSHLPHIIASTLCERHPTRWTLRRNI